MLKTPKFDLSNLPGSALVGIDAVVAVGPYAKTKFYSEMAAGRAPQPALREPRCTRWRWSDIRDWLERLADPARSAQGGRHE